MLVSYMVLYIIPRWDWIEDRLLFPSICAPPWRLLPQLILGRKMAVVCACGSLLTLALFLGQSKLSDLTSLIKALTTVTSCFCSCPLLLLGLIPIPISLELKWPGNEIRLLLLCWFLSFSLSSFQEDAAGWVCCSVGDSCHQKPQSSCHLLCWPCDFHFEQYPSTYSMALLHATHLLYRTY